MAWLDGRMRAASATCWWRLRCLSCCRWACTTSSPGMRPFPKVRGANLRARAGETLRQALDLEHWGAFQNSFRELAAMVTEIADGKRGAAPETIAFLSGDVHYSYVAEVERASGSRILQAVSSPIRNPLPRLMRSFAAVMSYGLATPVGAWLPARQRYRTRRSAGPASRAHGSTTTWPVWRWHRRG